MFRSMWTFCRNKFVLQEVLLRLFTFLVVLKELPMQALPGNKARVQMPNTIFQHPLYGFHATKFLCCGWLWYLITKLSRFRICFKSNYRMFHTHHDTPLCVSCRRQKYLITNCSYKLTYDNYITGVWLLSNKCQHYRSPLLCKGKP